MGCAETGARRPCRWAAEAAREDAGLQRTARHAPGARLETERCVPVRMVKGHSRPRPQHAGDASLVVRERSPVMPSDKAY